MRIPYVINHIDPMIIKILITKGEILERYDENPIPIIIKIVSDKLQIKHTIKTKFFLKPCLITNKFCGPIAMIKLKPIIKPWIYSKIFILYYV